MVSRRSGWKIDAEFSKLTHSRGTLSMARLHDPNSAGSQFFIVLKDSFFLDGHISVKVIDGMDVVDKEWDSKLILKISPYRE